ncbi:FHIPEP family type III secretion protein, partial [Pseudomonas sp. FW305-BF6]|uniref:FHIPEP family type III secretion protein n=1 Tax=Pseudomonas sp. FW305-BF6 TaxID=2070673 RepID=UPI00156FD0CF
SITLLGLVTPLNDIVTLPIGALLAFGAFQLSRKPAIDETIIEEQQEEIVTNDLKAPESVVKLLQVDPIEFEFGYGLIPLADTNQGGDLLDRIV